MTLMGPLHLLFSATFVACGMVVAGLSARAYHHTRKPSMLHLALGFSLVAGATAATALSLQLGRVPVSGSLLVVEAAISTVGLLFVVYSLLTTSELSFTSLSRACVGVRVDSIIVPKIGPKIGSSIAFSGVIIWAERLYAIRSSVLMLTSDVRGADVGSETETQTTMFETHRDDERRGQVGIGTLIVFIAMVLVAAIAAGVLVNTAGFLQSTAEQSGEESVEKVTNRLEVVSSYGEMDDNGEEIGDMYLTVRLGAGSDTVDMDDVTVAYLSGSDAVTLTNFTGTDTDDGTLANSSQFSVTEVKDDDGSFGILNDAGDRFQLVIDANDIANGDNSTDAGLAPGSEVKLEISTKSGDTTVYTIVTPDTYSSKAAGEPVAL